MFLYQGAAQHKPVDFSNKRGVRALFALLDIGYLLFDGAIALQEIVAFEKVETQFRDFFTQDLSRRGRLCVGGGLDAQLAGNICLFAQQGQAALLARLIKPQITLELCRDPVQFQFAGQSRRFQL